MADYAAQNNAFVLALGLNQSLSFPCKHTETNAKTGVAVMGKVRVLLTFRK